MLIFSVLEIASLSPYWLQTKFSMSLFFNLFTFAINLWHRKFVTADVTAMFINNQYGIQWRGQDSKKKVCIWRGAHCTAKRLTDEFPEKSWTKHGVIKLLKKLQDTGTVDRPPGSRRPRSARTEENTETVNDLVLSQEDKPQTHISARYHGRRVFIGRLCPALFVGTCVWNVSRGAVHRSWQTRTALLAWSALSFCFRSSGSMPLSLSVTHVEELKSVHLKCNLFAFSSIPAKYPQIIWIFNFPG